MASQIAHVVYAKKYFEALETDEGILRLKNQGAKIIPLAQINKDEFVLGACFPDIRLVDKNIKRKDTHMFFGKVDLNFSGLTSFQAGWKYHLYCDMRREEILNKYDFYSLSGATDCFGRPAKFLEDEIIYDEYDNWEKIYHYFNNVPMIDTGIDVSFDTFALWYAIIARYIQKKPDDRTYQIIISKLPGLSERMDDYLKSIRKLRREKKICELLQKVAEEII